MDQKRLAIEALVHGLDIGPARAAVLISLMNGRSPTARELAESISAHRPPKKCAIFETISFLRRTLGDDVIITEKHGRVYRYSLSKAGFRRCEAAIRAASVALDDMRAHLAATREAMVEWVPAPTPDPPAPKPRENSMDPAVMRGLRKRLGMAMRPFGALVGKSATSINWYESGRYTIPADVAQACEKLGSERTA